MKQSHHQQYPRIFFGRQSHADKSNIDDLPMDELDKRGSQPVVLSQENARLQTKDMNDIFYVRQEKNLSELYARAKATLEEQNALDDS